MRIVKICSGHLEGVEGGQDSIPVSRKGFQRFECARTKLKFGHGCAAFKRYAAVGGRVGSIPVSRKGPFSKAPWASAYQVARGHLLRTATIPTGGHNFGKKRKMLLQSGLM